MRFVLVVVAAVMFLVIRPVMADEARSCDGPADLCAQIEELQQSLAQEQEKKEQKAEQLEESEKKVVDDAGAAGILGSAMAIAIGLKLFISALKSWGGLFKSDQGKAVIRVITLVAGLAVGLFTNLALKMPWWQAVIVAGGGPAAIALHEIIALIPALRGKGKLPPEEAPEEPTETPASTS